LAIASGATFVARSFSGDIPHLTKILIEAINHKGFALVDILQPCTTLNHTNTFAWYRERIYNINDISGNSARYNLEETGYLPNNKNLAFAKTQEWGEKIPTGIFYKEERLTLENQLLSKDTVLADQPLELSIEKLLAEFN